MEETFVIDLTDNKTYILLHIGELLCTSTTVVYMACEEELINGSCMPFTEDYVRNNCLILK